MYLFNNIKKQLCSPKGWVLLDQVVFSATSFITTLLLARQLGIQLFGAYSLIVLYLYLLLGISSALITGPFQVLYAANPQPGKYISSLALLQLGIILLFCSLTYGLALFNTALLPGLKENIVPVILMLAGFLLQDFYRRILLALNRPRPVFIADALGGLLQSGILLYYYLTGGLTLQSGFYVIGLTYIPSLLFAFPAIGFKRVSLNEIRLVAKLHVHHGKWLLATSLLQWWGNNFLMATAGIFVGYAALGALRLSQTLFGVLNAVLAVLENYALPRASALLHQQNTTGFSKYLYQTGRQTLLFSLPFLLAAFLFPGYILSLAGGAGYTAYAYALQGTALLYIIIVMGYPLRIAIRALLLNKEFFIAYLVSGLFSLVAAKVMVQQWQLAGVIAALLLNQLLMLAYWRHILKNKKIIIWKLFM